MECENIIMSCDLFSIPFLALYAETHFRFFRLFPSLLYKKQPEILFDMPARIQPGKDIPVILLVNDIDTFPVAVKEVSLTVSQNGSTRVIFSETSIEKYKINHPFDFQCLIYLFLLPQALFVPGRFSINGKAAIQQKKRLYFVLNDNFAGSSRLSLTGRIASDFFPGRSWSLYGDLHVHSQYSRSHVEFGPPLSIIDAVADASGLSFVGITDHSYDLACTMEDYRSLDPEIKAWISLKRDFQDTSYHFKTTMILGEEVSCVNMDNKMVHVGALGISEYIPGNSDGARKKDTLSDLTVIETVSAIKQQKGISFAAHPGSLPGCLQRLFLDRGRWFLRDIHDQLTCYQAVNSGFTASWYRARRVWIAALLSRRKLPLIAGNDSHGDFNRYRAIKTPFVSLYENSERYFGCARTGIYTTSGKSQDDILAALTEGKTFITTGPFACISSSEQPKDCCISHTILAGDISALFILGHSTGEFGRIKILRVFRGYYKTMIEKMIFYKPYTEHTLYSISEMIQIDRDSGEGYLRIELFCIDTEGRETAAATSPCYF